MLKTVRPFLGIIFCLALLAAPLLAQEDNHPASAALSPAEADAWREDLRYMAAEMSKHHKNLFHAVTRDRYEAAVKSLDERMPTLARHQAIVELARIVAMVEDGHTALAGLLSDPKI